MIHYLNHSSIDKSKWDTCIDSSYNANIYAYSWYLDVICPGWDALIEDDYVSVMPLTKGRKFLMDYLYPPYFAQQLGIFSVQKISEMLCFTFLNKIPGDIKFIEINLNHEMKSVPAAFASKKNINIILDINRSYELIKAGYSENHSRNLKKAAKSNLLHFFVMRMPKLLSKCSGITGVKLSAP
jgi:hypothetical protein